MIDKALIAIGTAVLGTGISQVFDRPKAGWALVGLGALLLIVAFILLLSGRGIAVLTLSDPIPVRNQSIDFEADGRRGSPSGIDMWRLRLTNTKKNTAATNVRFIINGSDPQLSFLPIDVHLKHDRLPTNSHTVRYDELLDFDIVGMECQSEGGFRLHLYRSDIGALYAFPIPDQERPSMRRMRAEGLILHVVIYVEPPTRQLRQSFRAFVDERNRFMLERCHLGCAERVV